VSGGHTANLVYDPLGRLQQIDNGAGTTTRFVHDGDALVDEYDGSGNLTQRYLHGTNAAADDPLVWYSGGVVSSATRHFLRADHEGSIIALTNQSGAPSINSYDEYGIPSSSNAGRFQYTGQIWLSEIRMQYSKARMYSPTLGRFLQTDPIGYRDRPNWYAYTHNDPVNGKDPSGLKSETFTGSMIPGVISNGLTINGIDAQAAQMSLTNAAVAAFPNVSDRVLTEIVSCGLAPVSSCLNAPIGGLGVPRGNGCGGSLPGEILVCGERRLLQASAASGFVTAPVVDVGGDAVGESSSAQDYCGSEGHNVPDGNWGTACAVHDQCYATPGAIKIACDIQLMANITAVCGAKTLSLSLCASVGALYGFGLVFFGLTPFYHPSRDAFEAAQGKR
jgi:RHS repeat-associated protein